MKALLSVNTNSYVVVGLLLFLVVFGLLIFIIVKSSKASKARKMKSAYPQINIGMSKSQVLSMLGEPTGKRINGKVETYSWKNSEFKGMLRGGNIVRAITIDFESDVVIGYDSDHMDKGAL